MKIFSLKRHIRLLCKTKMPSTKSIFWRYFAIVFGKALGVEDGAWSGKVERFLEKYQERLFTKFLDQLEVYLTLFDTVLLTLFEMLGWRNLTLFSWRNFMLLGWRILTSIYVIISNELAMTRQLRSYIVMRTWNWRRMTWSIRDLKFT